MNDVAFVALLDDADNLSENGHILVFVQFLGLHEVLLQIDVRLGLWVEFVWSDAVKDEHETTTYVAGVDGGAWVLDESVFLVGLVL